MAETPPATPPARPTPPFLFLFLDLPFGAAVGYASIAMPYWVREGGLSVGQLAALAAAASAPHALKFLWIPAIDLVGTRRGWYLATCVATAALLVAASLVAEPTKHLWLYGALVALGQATSTTGHVANSALMAITTRFEDKGKVAGFSMASNLGGTGLLGALAIAAGARASQGAAGLLLGAVVLASGACALRIAEPPRALAAGSGLLRTAWRRIVEAVRDLWSTARSREGLTGLVISVAPVGLGALTNIFSGLAQDFSASARVVGFVNGLGGGVVGAAGALIGGWLADRMNRRLAYGVAGGLTGLSALAMLLSPMTPATYAWGTLAYNFTNGIAFATWAGMVLEVVGPGAATATKYTLFNAAANGAINAATWADGAFADASPWPALRGARGSLAMDAALTALGIGVLLAMVAVSRRGAGRGTSAAR